jgi:hypothetical protein
MQNITIDVNLYLDVNIRHDLNDFFMYWCYDEKPPDKKDKTNRQQQQTYNIDIMI